jgi:hypothetical protein
MNHNNITAVNIHKNYAPCWAVTLILPGSKGIATVYTDLGEFWKGYVLDMVLILIPGDFWHKFLY